MSETKCEMITYKPSLKLRVVRFLIFCFSFYIGDQIVRSGGGKIPFYIMFLLPAVNFIPLIEGFICRITLSDTSIIVRSLTGTWTLNWSQISSWKLVVSSGQSRFGTHFIFYADNKSYELKELHKCSASKHVDEIKDWIKKHVKGKKE